MNNDKYYMDKPCNACPYRKDVTPYLRPKRGAELANLVYSNHNFYCHKTLSEESDEDGELDIIQTSKVCAGFLSLCANAKTVYPEEFTPSTELVYESVAEMTKAYKKSI